MYDDYARNLINLLPDLPDFDRDECRRVLSSAYYFAIQQRLGQQELLNQSSIEEIRGVLRSLVDALESVAIFDRLNGIDLPTDVETASAFVAAEALALSLPWSVISNEEESSPLFKSSNYDATEAALLYMIGGYDINAASIVQNVDEIDLNRYTPETFTTASGIEDATSAFALSRLKRLCQGNISSVQLPDFTPGLRAIQETTYPNIVSKVRSQLNVLLINGIDTYIAWLRGDTDTSYERARSLLRRVQQSSVSEFYGGYAAFAEYYHISSLLIAAIDRTSERSLFHHTPLPPTTNDEFLNNFRAYLRRRSMGTSQMKGRPFLWPTTQEYIRSCLPGPSHGAVVSMPTGSGKSFLAELATVHALASGWVLYLAPTNALVNQIRRDLTLALQPFDGIAIRSFVGGEEYTTFGIEEALPSSPRYVSIMTPEKCMLALRLYPEHFASCTLCIFDECHLIGDMHRGANADIVIASLSLWADRMVFLFMSAMLANPEEIAEWLSWLQPTSTLPLRFTWRPTRTLRGILAFDRIDFESEYAVARERLNLLPPRRMNQEFNASLALVAGLSGPWNLGDRLDFRVNRLPLSFPAKASKRGNGLDFSGWKNTASRLLAQLFAHNGIPTLCFLLTSRHHAFSSAAHARGTFQSSHTDMRALPARVEAWLTIAASELGTTTPLRDLLLHGIAVHTSAMLDAERIASEEMFGTGTVHLMFATGTLSQGLNLPSIAVVISGTTMGDAREQSPNSGRIESTILNSFGRAGRPGFSNQGIAILVSDEPFFVSNSNDQLDTDQILRAMPVLQQSDASVSIRSPLESLIDILLSDEPNLAATITEQTELSILIPSGDLRNERAARILSRTFAAHRAEAHVFAAELAAIIEQLSVEQMTGLSAPEWLLDVAARAGVPLSKAFHMYRAYEARGWVHLEQYHALTTIEWMAIFGDVMALMPLREIQDYYLDSESQETTVIARMYREAVTLQLQSNQESSNREHWVGLWAELFELAVLYMRGATYTEIAVVLLGTQSLPVNGNRNSGAQPIPKVFAFLGNVMNKLSIDAGCFLALNEAIFAGSTEGIAEALSVLPICIRHGLDSASTLYWYRFSLPNRISAHVLHRNFPLPAELAGDEARRRWVISTRRRWIAGEFDHLDEDPLLEDIKTVMHSISIDTIR